MEHSHVEKNLVNRRLNRLAAGMAAILGLSSPTVFATVFVTNCNDSGPGSLRLAATVATSGDTLDMQGLDGVCSQITMEMGAIGLSQKAIKIVGPGADKLFLSAQFGVYPNTHQYANRILTHTGTGPLVVQGVTLTHGYVAAAQAKGGCIYSTGSVVLQNAKVSGCHAVGDDAAGGAVFANQEVTLIQSSMIYNGTSGTSFSAGGAVYAVAAFRSYYSTVSTNSAGTTTQSTSTFAGGIRSLGSVYLYNSTIDSNFATGNDGGVAVNGNTVKIVNSTISSNQAFNGSVGGLNAVVNSVEIINSTIASNKAAVASPHAPAGAAVLFQGSSRSFVMQSSIMANNTYSQTAIEADLFTNAPVTGGNNFVQVAVASLPDDTIVGKCAFLGPLRDNGGLTRTQSLLGHSPAIDAGNNVFGASFDQRGKLSVNGENDHPRVVGPPGFSNPRADIGADEVNRADEIYDANFDSC